MTVGQLGVIDRDTYLVSMPTLVRIVRIVTRTPWPGAELEVRLPSGRNVVVQNEEFLRLH